jgi:hypothetical protein
MLVAYVGLITGQQGYWTDQNMVRSRKPPCEKRSAQKAFRFTRDELLQLDFFAAESGQNASDFIRSRAFAEPDRTALPPLARRDIFKALQLLEAALPHEPNVKELTARVRQALT